MTKLDAGLITSLPASDPGSAAVWGSKRINPRPQSCLCLTWSGYPSNDDDDSDSVTINVPSKSLLSVRGMKGRVSSGGYSNLGTRDKDFQKPMFKNIKKEKEF